MLMLLPWESVCICLLVLTLRHRHHGHGPVRALPCQTWTCSCHLWLRVYHLHRPLQASWAQWVGRLLCQVCVYHQLPLERRHLGLSPGRPYHVPFRWCSPTLSSLRQSWSTLEPLQTPSTAWWLVGSPPTQPQQMMTFLPNKTTPRLAEFLPCHVQYRHQDGQWPPTPSPSQAWLKVFRRQGMLLLLPSVPIPPSVPFTSGVASLPAAPPARAAPPDVQVMGDAPPQTTVGPSVPQNMGPDALGQLSPSDGWDTSLAQHKSGSKQAHGCSRSRSPTGDVSEAGRDGHSHQKQPRDSSASSSPSRQQSPLSK